MQQRLIHNSASKFGRVSCGCREGSILVEYLNNHIFSLVSNSSGGRCKSHSCFPIYLCILVKFDSSSRIEWPGLLSTDAKIEKEKKRSHTSREIDRKDSKKSAINRIYSREYQKQS